MERYSCQRKFCIRPEQTVGESPETWKRGSSLPPVAPALHHTRMVHTKQVLGDRSKNSFRRPTQQISWSVLTPVVSLHSFWERNFSTNGLSPSYWLTAYNWLGRDVGPAATGEMYYSIPHTDYIPACNCRAGWKEDCHRIAGSYCSRISILT